MFEIDGNRRKWRVYKDGGKCIKDLQSAFSIYCHDGGYYGTQNIGGTFWHGISRGQKLWAWVDLSDVADSVNPRDNYYIAPLRGLKPDDKYIIRWRITYRTIFLDPLDYGIQGFDIYGREQGFFRPRYVQPWVRIVPDLIA
jgi:hypothetical protein